MGRAAPLGGDLTDDEYVSILAFLRRKKLLPYVSLVSSGFLYGGKVVSSVAAAKSVFGYRKR
jgi:hypothetical protein